MIRIYQQTQRKNSFPMCLFGFLVHLIAENLLIASASSGLESDYGYVVRYWKSNTYVKLLNYYPLKNHRFIRLKYHIYWFCVVVKKCTRQLYSYMYITRVRYLSAVLNNKYTFSLYAMLANFILSFADIYPISTYFRMRTTVTMFRGTMYVSALPSTVYFYGFEIHNTINTSKINQIGTF